MQDPRRDGLAGPDERGHHGIVDAAGDEVRRTVDRIDNPGERCFAQGAYQIGVVCGGLFAHDRDVQDRAQPAGDHHLGRPVGDGNQLALGFLADVAVEERAEPRQYLGVGRFAEDVGHVVDAHTLTLSDEHYRQSNSERG